MRQVIVLAFMLILSSNSWSQDFISPVIHEMKLAGTFGELRSNHFHMGIDIKSSNRASGDPIMAVADGFVSRIKVSRSGYGNALYIDHPSGHTTVYGHLRNYSARIDSLLNRRQEEINSFEINIDLNPNDLPVQQGEIIGNMGNSGSSYGPHLHFEVRETESEAPLNPMRYGFTPQDTEAPRIRAVKIYGLDDKLGEIFATEVTPASAGTNRYKINDQEIGAWRIGIAVNTYDPMNSGYNKNGVYKIELLEDGVERFSCHFDSISFSDTQYINAHIDYAHYKIKKSRFHRCFVLEGNRLPIYSDSSAIIKLYKDQPKNIEIRVSDFAGNTSTLTFKVRRAEKMSAPVPKVYNYLLPYDEPHIVSYNGVDLYFPDSCFYNDQHLYLGSSPGDYLTPVYHIGKNDIPLHRPMKAHFQVDEIPDSTRSKLCVVECSRPENLRSYGGVIEGDYLLAPLNSFGNYALAYDTIAPSIEVLKLGTGGRLSFKIEDNYSDSGSARGLRYVTELDGEWAKFVYDLKKNTISHKIQLPRTSSEHVVKVLVTDDRDNTRVLEKKFIW